MRCTADTETGDYIDDPTEAQLRDLIAGLGQATGTFVTITPASEDRGEEHTATTGSPASIARDLITWIAARD